MVIMLEAAELVSVAFEYAMTIWSDANPMAQLEDRLPRWVGEVAESADEMKTSSGAPAAIAVASAFEPPEMTGATGMPVEDEKPFRSAVVSVA